MEPLRKDVIDRIRRGVHPYDLLVRTAAISAARRYRPLPVQERRAFSDELRRILEAGSDRTVCVARGGYTSVPVIANEQIRRSRLTGHPPGLALRAAVSGSHCIDNRDWGTAIWFHSEGLAYGDVFVEPRDGYAELVSSGYRPPSPVVLCSRPLEMPLGYSLAANGEGWFRYELDVPPSDRLRLGRLADRELDRASPVLTLRALDESLRRHESTWVVVGASVGAVERYTLARWIAVWQRYGGRVRVACEGTMRPFVEAGCIDVVAAGVASHDADLERRLRHEPTWIDAVVALDPPARCAAAILQACDRPDRPWPVWVVGFGANMTHRFDCEVDLDAVIEGLRDPKAPRLPGPAVI